jgi:hypothetical protein
LLVLLHRMLAPVKSHQSWFFFFVGFVYLFFCLLGVSNLIQNWNFAIGLIKKNFFCFCFCFISNFCIIEGPETVQDFVQMQLQEIQDNIKSRRNKIFLLMEEVSL